MTDFFVETHLEISPDNWLELENEGYGYTLGGGAFGDRTMSFKQITAGEDMPWLRGEVVRASAPSNIGEPLEVWVSADDHFTFDTRMEALRTAICEQLTYRIMRQFGNSRITYTCMPPQQVRITTQREYLWATTGLFQATIPTKPDPLREELL